MRALFWILFSLYHTAKCIFSLLYVGIFSVYLLDCTGDKAIIIAFYHLNEWSIPFNWNKQKYFMQMMTISRVWHVHSLLRMDAVRMFSHFSCFLHRLLHFACFTDNKFNRMHRDFFYFCLTINWMCIVLDTSGTRQIQWKSTKNINTRLTKEIQMKWWLSVSIDRLKTADKCNEAIKYLK